MVKKKKHPMHRAKLPTQIDRAVGERIKAARTARQMSMETLAGQIGVTFQQVQKYERGSNRITVGRLCQCAQALGCDVAALIPKAIAAQAS